MLIRHKRAIILTPVVLAVLAYGLSLLMTKQYTATLRVAPSKNVQTYSWILNNELVLDQIAAELGLAQHYSTATQTATRQAISAHVKVTVNNKDAYLDIIAIDRDPAFAAKVANTAGRALERNLYDMRLLDISQSRYALELRYEAAQKDKVNAEKLLNSAQVQDQLKRISPSDRYGIVALADIQAEATLQAQGATRQGGTSDLVQSQIVKMQDQLSSLQRLTAGKGNHRDLSDPGALAAAVTTLQQYSYWNALTERLKSRLEFAQKEERDQLKITWATQPDQRSGPRPLLLAIFAAAAGLVGALVYAFIAEGIASSRTRHSSTWQEVAQEWRSPNNKRRNASS
ncbi:Wzz/FepE/Etk N-terminal domain-containing protein [Cupriavidus sp. UYPR2.512]|uniref:Wzz/FepE/Etk N-terminal domain-containing protein n=1 Tax=Cupriavidus sp. UYPR2.512 TaxID=1080187 RepID=UPI001E3EDD36|nr:Wzz/FepE/Etk N-terminal domain-containing protein [Cupriavidus sp. UYPR2.512]